MSQYIDGFTFPIATDRLEKYRQLASEVAGIWKEHGALDYCEYSGDDMTLAGTGSFVKALSARENETIIFGWVAFESREARDRANAKVAADPRMEELVSVFDTGFDPGRMAYAGFKRLIKCPANEAV